MCPIPRDQFGSTSEPHQTSRRDWCNCPPLLKQLTCWRLNQYILVHLLGYGHFPLKISQLTEQPWVPRVTVHKRRANELLRAVVDTTRLIRTTSKQSTRIFRIYKSVTGGCCYCSGGWYLYLVQNFKFFRACMLVWMCCVPTLTTIYLGLQHILSWCTKLNYNDNDLLCVAIHSISYLSMNNRRRRIHAEKKMIYLIIIISII